MSWSPRIVLALALAGTLGGGQAVITGCQAEVAPATAVAPAEAEYQAGLALFATRARADLTAAAEHFQRAVDLDPQNALAWSGLADANALLGLYSISPPSRAMPKAREAAVSAIRLDSGLARSHASLGLALYLHDWDWDAAESSFRRAIEIEPGYATAHHWYAMMLSATGRHREAVEQMEQALAADPDSRIIAIKAATVFTAAGQFERAERQLDRCLDLYPGTALAHRELGFLRLAQGKPEQALGPFERAAELSGGESRTSGGLGYVYGVLGREADARRVLAALEERAKTEPLPPLYLALVHAGLAERDQAFDSLEAAFEARDPGLVYLYTKPGLESLRSDSRFSELGRKLQLPQAAASHDD